MASRSSNRAEVPEAKEALDRFKMEVADELGVRLYGQKNDRGPGKTDGRKVNML